MYPYILIRFTKISSFFFSSITFNSLFIDLKIGFFFDILFSFAKTGFFDIRLSKLNF